jgi:hypothetical protein
MSYHEVAGKFRGCADFAKWPRQKGDTVIEFVKSMESAPDVSRLTAMLTG